MEVLNLDIPNNEVSLDPEIYFQHYFPGNAPLYSYDQQSVLFITDCHNTQNHSHLDCKGTLLHISKLAMFFLFLND